jgi:hypothetical protein
MSGLITTLATQGPDSVSELHDAVAAPDVMQFGDAPVFHVLGLTGATVEVVDGHDSAFGCSDEAADARDHCIQVPRVLSKTAAEDGQVVKEQEVTAQRADHVIHPVED